MAATIKWGAIFHFVGIIVSIVGIAMLLPAGLDLFEDAGEPVVFVGCAGMSIFVGGLMTLATRGGARDLSLREGVLTILCTWIAISLVGSLPFQFANAPLGFTDAVFESVSGLTATGSTVYLGLDVAPKSILLWRFLLVWLGGFGLVTFAVLVLPYLRIGGMQMFMLDLSARPGKIVPRTAELVGQIGVVYVLMTLACAISFGAAGMGAFDAVGHAMAAIATGGFSSHDAGLGYFKSPAVEWVATLFMFLAALPFALYLYVMRGEPGPLLLESQVRLFLLVVVVCVLLLTAWLMLQLGLVPEDAFRWAAFNLVSIISTTGFVAQDYNLWGGFPALILWMAMILGGCTGSTAGGIKMFRLYILLQTLRAQLHRQVYPSGVFAVTYNRRPLPEAIQTAVAGYFFLYCASVVLFALGLGFTGLGFEASLGAAATSLGGVGPALGPKIGPSGTFHDVSDGAKWILTFAMLAGRLEIMLILIPFTRTFWRS